MIAVRRPAGPRPDKEDLWSEVDPHSHNPQSQTKLQRSGRMSHSAKSINYWHYYRRLFAIFSAPTCRGQLGFSRLYVQQVGADYLIMPWANVPTWKKISVCKWRWSGLMESLAYITCCLWHGQETRDIDPMLGHCWTDVVDGGPPLTQHWFIVSFAGWVAYTVDPLRSPLGPVWQI